MACSSCGKRRRKFTPPQPAAITKVTETLPIPPIPVNGTSQQPNNAPVAQVKNTSEPDVRRRNFRQIPINGNK